MGGWEYRRTLGRSKYHSGQTFNLRPNGQRDSALSKRFAAMVFNNNLRGAVALVTEKGKGHVLKLTGSTRDAMRAKHPDAAPLHTDALLAGEMPPDVHPAI